MSTKKHKGWMRVRPDLIPKITKLATAEHRSFPGQVNHMLEESLKAPATTSKVKP